MARSLALLGAAGAGAAAMYLLDPERGNRRRALVRDQLVRFQHRSLGALDSTTRDLAHRTRGIAAETISQLKPEALDDVVLAERVRAELGRAVSHPSAIRVLVQDGRVLLGGPILADEVDRLLAHVRSVRGVRDVVGELEVHEGAGDVPGLQGRSHRTRERLEQRQSGWPPTARLIAGGLGGWLVARGLSSVERGNLLGIAAGLGGLGLLARGLTNAEPSRLLGLGGRRAIDVQKTIGVRAPIERVFDFWARLENFPRFMGHVREVRRVAADRYAWVVVGPAGTPIRFEALVTKRVPDQLIAWKTLPGQIVEHAGIVRFEPEPNDATRVSVRMSYNPPAGALGHVVASLFGADPKHAMDEDLVRFKSLIEEGRVTAHSGTITRESVEPPSPHDLW